jgi:hypothetical protein
MDEYFNEVDFNPCPFCGKEAKVHWNENKDIFQIGCLNQSCSIQPLTPYYLNGGFAEAKQIWNTRATK